jgi:hypothetical protein
VFTHRIYGWDVDPYQAQEAINNAIAAGEAIVLEHNLKIQRGELNFKNATVHVNGTVIFADGVMNMADAQVSWAPNAKIEQPEAYILRKGHKAAATGKVPDGAMVEFVEGVEEIMSTSEAAAVRNFKLGPKQNHDYSKNPDGVDARVTNENLRRLYVVGTLSVPSEGTPLSDWPVDPLTLIPLDTLDATGTIPVEVVARGIDPGTCSTLTSSRGVTITWPANREILIPNVRVEAEKGITLVQQGFGTPLIIPGKLTGPGTLTFGATDITINGGDGNFIATGDRTRKLSVYSTGKAVFTDNVTIFIDNLGSVIHSAVTFKGNVFAADSLALMGDVTLGQGSLGTGQHIAIAQNRTLTLGKGKTITVQIEPAKTTKIITAPLLTAAGGDVELFAENTGVTLSTLPRPKDDPEDIAEAKAILLRATTAPGVNPRRLWIVDGTLQVLPDAIISMNGTDAGTSVPAIGGNVYSINLNTNIDGGGKKFGYLAVAAGGTLGLTTANDFHIGDATISGPFTFIPDGGTVKLGNYRIAGSAPGTKLTPAKGTTGSISVVGTTGTLALEQVELNVAAYGSVRLNALGSRVSLDNGAKIILLAGENGQPTDWSNLKIGGVADSTILGAQLTGAFVGLTPDPAAAKQPALSVAHKGGQLAEVNITVVGATGLPVILGKGAKPEFSSR